MNIKALPPEVLAHVFTKLPGRDLCSVAMTCKKFWDAVQIESVWQFKCKDEFGVGQEAFEGSSVHSFRMLYTKLLFPSGHLLGVWQPQMGPYGGLVQIKMTSGIITATQYLAPVDPKVYLPLRIKQLFQIRMDEEDGQAHVECLKGENGCHKLQILPNVTNSEQEFTIKCCKPEKHRSHQNRRGNLQDLRAWIQEEMGVDEANLFTQNFDYHVELLRMKYIKLNEFDCICTFKRLDPPNSAANMPIQPGLFKGTYGGHGIEIIYMTYENDRLQGIKITGDPNVPVNKMSMEVHLDEAMILNTSQQTNLHTLQQLDRDEVVVTDSKSSEAPQPFHLPMEVHDRGVAALGTFLNVPLNRCKCRYFATGLIAMPGFRDACRTPAHFIVFNEDTLAFFWLELRSISIYSRVHEEMWT